MFYDIQLLRYQSDGVFWMAWVAGIFGTKSARTSALLKLEDRHVKSSNTARLCQSLQKYIMSDSSQVSKRMSLRLSAILMQGIIRIHSRKVDLFQFELNRLFDKIQRPLIAGFMQITEETSKEKKKRPRKKQVKQSVPEIGGEIPNVEIPDDAALIEGGLAALEQISVAPIEQITLPEDVPRRETEEIENLGFGDEENGAAQLIMASTDFSRPGAFEKAITDIEAIMYSFTLSLHAPSTLERIVPLTPPEVTHPELDNGRKRKRSSDGSEMTKRPKIDDGPVEAASEAVAAADIQEPPAAAQSEILQPVDKPRRERKKYTNIEVIRKTLSVKHRQWANEYGTHVDKEYEIATINYEKILNNWDAFLDDDILDEFKIHRIVETSSPPALPEEIREIDPNIASAQQSTQIDQRRETTESQIGAVSLPGIGTPQESLIQPIAFRDSDEALQPIHSTPIITTRPTFAPREHPIIEEEIEISAIQPTAVETTRPTLSPVDEEEVLNRGQSQQKRIIEIVKNWNYERADLTIDDLCPTPINRSNISITFTNLLALYKKLLVDLVHQADSLELGKILPGPKLLQEDL